MNGGTLLERLLEGAEVEWMPLGNITEYSPTRIDASDVDANTFVGVDNLVADKGGRVEATYLPNTARLTAYEVDDILIGNIRPYLKKIWQATCSGGCSGDVLAIRVRDLHKETINTKFLYYTLSSDQFFAYNMRHARGGKMPRGDKMAIMKFKVALPCPENPEKSLAIQAEIVRTLDTFSALTSELTSELNKRQKQYNYYRDLLLNFEKDEVEWKTLSEVGEFIRGKRFTKADYVEDGIDVIHYGEIYTRYGVHASRAFSQVKKSLAGSLRYAEPGDVIITDVGETVEDVGKAVAWLGEGKVAIHDHCYAFRHDMNPKFVSYYMQTSSFIFKRALGFNHEVQHH